MPSAHTHYGTTLPKHLPASLPPPTVPSYLPPPSIPRCLPRRTLPFFSHYALPIPIYFDYACCTGRAIPHLLLHYLPTPPTPPTTTTPHAAHPPRTCTHLVAFLAPCLPPPLPTADVLLYWMFCLCTTCTADTLPAHLRHSAFTVHYLPGILLKRSVRSWFSNTTGERHIARDARRCCCALTYTHAQHSDGTTPADGFVVLLRPPAFASWRQHRNAPARRVLQRRGIAFNAPAVVLPYDWFGYL